jgi:uncharacterized protein YdhG (YjbR/CyaY superfamily)
VSKRQFGSIDEYLAAQPPQASRALESLRRAILNAVPGGEEAISYNMPTIKLRGSTVLHFALWKDFCSVYPANSRLVEALGDELTPYLAEKSTLRFPLAQPLPLELIERIAEFRAAEISSRT